MYNFAIVGCGHIAKKHADAIHNIEDARLVAVCDKIPESMEYYKDKYGVTAYTDLLEMLKNNDIDIINICTPSGFHANIAVEAAKAGKHIVVEKPISLTLEDADTIIRTCRDNNVKLTVVHPNRFRPAVKALKQLLEEGMFGKISHANATVRWNRNQAYYDQAPWRGTKSLDGGVLMNQAIHNLDLLLWLVGDFIEVSSMNATRFRDIEAEDVSLGLVRFESGALGVIEAAVTIYPKNLEETLSIFGETGTVKIGGPTANFFEHLNVESLSKEDTEQLIVTVKKNPIGKPGHECIIEDIIQAIKEDREPVVTGEDGKRALELVVDLYKAADINQLVNK
jgi:UDP-N-acetyl-2-amino-2-deoxyglucuronate dehydrogenase